MSSSETSLLISSPHEIAHFRQEEPSQLGRNLAIGFLVLGILIAAAGVGCHFLPGGFQAASLPVGVAGGVVALAASIALVIILKKQKKEEIHYDPTFDFADSKNLDTLRKDFPELADRLTDLQRDLTLTRRGYDKDSGNFANFAYNTADLIIRTVKGHTDDSKRLAIWRLAELLLNSSVHNVDDDFGTKLVIHAYRYNSDGTVPRQGLTREIAHSLVGQGKVDQQFADLILRRKARWDEQQAKAAYQGAFET